MKTTVFAVICSIAACAELAHGAITVGAFGPHGEGGTKNGQAFTLGAGGSVYELDAFLSVEGVDLNGALPGTSACLSRDSLPAGLGFGFFSLLASNGSDLVLLYSFSNATANVFTNLRLSVLFDAEIDEALNTFYNEYGTTSGAVGFGAGDADQWQIEEPGFQGGSLLRNLYLGSLSNSNGVPPGQSNDVAMALSFFLGPLWPGNTLTVRVMISEAGHALGSLALAQHDPAPASTTVITFSGQADLQSALTGTVFRDANTNGLPDAGEGLRGVGVVLELTNGTVQARATTDANGRYNLGNPLRPETYVVRVETNTLGPGLVNRVDPDQVPDNRTQVVLAAAAVGTNLDWGYLSTATFANTAALVPLNFQWRLDRPTGCLIGTLSLTNPPNSGWALAQPFQLGLHSSTNLYFANPTGTLGSGWPYVDLTEAVVSQAGGTFSAGKTVVVDGIRVYSRGRSQPSADAFELWSMQSK